jgi:lysozyme family protein
VPYPYGFLLLVLITINIILYNNPNILSSVLNLIKNLFNHSLLFLVFLFRISGNSHNASFYELLLSLGVRDNQQKVFYDALSWHLKHEGLIANHPLDPGGFTYAGISRNVHANWGGWEYLDNGNPIPESMIVLFYDSLVWRPMMCDSVPPAIAFYLFDTACLIGTPYAIYLLQKTLNIKPDGIMGPQTLQAIKNYNPKDLLSRLHASRIAFHNKIVQKYPNLNVFYNGWVRRACLTYQQSTMLLRTAQP